MRSSRILLVPLAMPAAPAAPFEGNANGRMRALTLGVGRVRALRFGRVGG